MIINGEIIRTIPSDKIIYILSNELLYKCHYNNACEKQYGRYFLNKMHLEVQISDDFKETEDGKVHRIIEFYKISYMHNRHEIVYYDLNDIKQGIKEVLDTKCNRMYFDLELSMHPYYRTDNFVQEIIEFGYILEDKNGEVIDKGSSFIKTVKHKMLTTRTLKFLNIKQEDVDNGLSVEEFHNLLMDLMTKYEPKILVWGRNDFLALDSFYEMHGLIPATSRKDFINLLQLYKTYHSLKNDPGLFKCYESYGYQIDPQTHDPLDDATVTREVYRLFKEEVDKVKDYKRNEEL